MTGRGPILAETEWLRDAALQTVLEMLDEGGEQARVVGGAVRNAIIGEPIGDIDIATTAVPEEVMRRAREAGLKVVPTGIEHGTVTVVSGGRGFEVTTLRRDVETHGRHATVAFGRDWEADARRRDFSMNAIYVDRSGKVFDPVHGLADALARHVRFIGDATMRIREDYLRILRFFRFHAAYGRGEPDRAGFLAAIRERDGLRRLSAERIGAEMRRLVIARGAPETVQVMSEAGLLEIVLAGVPQTGVFTRLREIAAALGIAPTPARALVAVGALVEEDATRIADRLRLSNADRLAMIGMVGLARRIDAGPEGVAAVRRMIYRHGNERVRDAALIGWAWARADIDDPAWRAVLDAALDWRAPAFPFSGRDVLALGLKPGPKVGAVLAETERLWVENGFRPEKDRLRAVLADTARRYLAAGA